MNSRIALAFLVALFWAQPGLGWGEPEPDNVEVLESIKDHVGSIQVTQAVIYGWYDNEMASYVNMMGDRTVTIAESMD